MNTSLALPVVDASQAGEARRAVAAWGRERGWSEEMAGRVALIVTELGRNLALHAQGGSLLLRPLQQGALRGVEILSLDAGPGMANFGACLADGYSTTGTAGIGLGAIRRASSEFTAYSQPGLGSALRSEVWPQSGGPSPMRWQVGAVNVPLPSEQVSGDAWTLHGLATEKVRVLVTDGLGHGEFAAEASRRAAEVFSAYPERPLEELLGDIHAALRSTRGAAGAIAEIDLGRAVVNYCGVGNISGCIVSPAGTTHLVSFNGTLGGQARQIRGVSHHWPAGGSLLLCSDGLRTHWQLDRYPGLLLQHPGLLAGVLYRDCQRGRDDATVVALRQHR